MTTTDRHFLDALGWEVPRERQFMKHELPFLWPLHSVLGSQSPVCRRLLGAPSTRLWVLVFLLQV
jgi:hypothetical protein